MPKVSLLIIIFVSNGIKSPGPVMLKLIVSVSAERSKILVPVFVIPTFTGI